MASENDLSGVVINFTPTKPDSQIQARHVQLNSKSSTVRIGRSTLRANNSDFQPANNNMWIPCPVVSRDHALLQLQQDGKVTITDTSSAHGTVLDGKDLIKGHPYNLISGSVVTFGTTVVRDRETFQPPCFTVSIAKTSVSDLNKPSAGGFACPELSDEESEADSLYSESVDESDTSDIESTNSELDRQCDLDLAQPQVNDPNQAPQSEKDTANIGLPADATQKADQPKASQQPDLGDRLQTAGGNKKDVGDKNWVDLTSDEPRTFTPHLTPSFGRKRTHPSTGDWESSKWDSSFIYISDDEEHASDIGEIDIAKIFEKPIHPASIPAPTPANDSNHHLAGPSSSAPVLLAPQDSFGSLSEEHKQAEDHNRTTMFGQNILFHDSPIKWTTSWDLPDLPKDNAYHDGPFALGSLPESRAQPLMSEFEFNPAVVACENTSPAELLTTSTRDQLDNLHRQPPFVEANEVEEVHKPTASTCKHGMSIGNLINDEVSISAKFHESTIGLSPPVPPPKAQSPQFAARQLPSPVTSNASPSGIKRKFTTINVPEVKPLKKPSADRFIRPCKHIKAQALVEKKETSSPIAQTEAESVASPKTESAASESANTETSKQSSSTEDTSESVSKERPAQRRRVGFGLNNWVSAAVGVVVGTIGTGWVLGSVDASQHFFA